MPIKVKVSRSFFDSLSAGANALAKLGNVNGPGVTNTPEAIQIAPPALRKKPPTIPRTVVPLKVTAVSDDVGVYEVKVFNGDADNTSTGDLVASDFGTLPGFVDQAWNPAEIDGGGSPLTVGTICAGLLIAQYSDGKRVYMMMGGGGGIKTKIVELVTGVTCVAGVVTAITDFFTVIDPD